MYDLRKRWSVGIVRSTTDRHTGEQITQLTLQQPHSTRRRWDRSQSELTYAGWRKWRYRWSRSRTNGLDNDVPRRRGNVSNKVIVSPLTLRLSRATMSWTSCSLTTLELTWRRWPFILLFRMQSVILSYHFNSCQRPNTQNTVGTVLATILT